jgi:hypothetical protein
MNRPAVFGTIVGALAAVSGGAAQTGAIEGAVNADSLGKRSIPGAEVAIPALQLSTHANFVGEFRLVGIAPGRYLMIATGAGRRGIGDSVTIVAGGTTYHDFVLATRAIVLDSVVSKAAVLQPSISPALSAFEERRRSSAGGYFITDSTLRKEEDRSLADIIRMHVPGVDMLHMGQSRVYLVSGRGPAGGHLQCYPDVYLDGVQLAKLPDPQFHSVVAVDITQFTSTEVSAIEFYPGGASLPVQFSHTSSGCGALLLWTREK